VGKSRSETDGSPAGSAFRALLLARELKTAVIVVFSLLREDPLLGEMPVSTSSSLSCLIYSPLFGDPLSFHDNSARGVKRGFQHEAKQKLRPHL
jgi:hypothetical protein